MNYFLFDVESTGMTNKDEVIQFSGLLFDEKFALKKFFNFYCDTQQTIDPGALKVHGISKEILKKLSDGKTFEDNFFEMLKILEQYPDLCWVSYNIEFDKRLVNQTLVNNGLESFDFGKDLPKFIKVLGKSNACLLQGMRMIFPGRGGHKLYQIVERLPYSKEDIQKAFAKLAITCNLDPELSYHNAAYDVYTSYLVFKYFAPKLMC